MYQYQNICILYFVFYNQVVKNTFISGTITSVGIHVETIVSTFTVYISRQSVHRKTLDIERRGELRVFFSFGR